MVSQHSTWAVSSNLFLASNCECWILSLFYSAVASAKCSACSCKAESLLTLCFRASGEPVCSHQLLLPFAKGQRADMKHSQQRKYSFTTLKCCIQRLSRAGTDLELQARFRLLSFSMHVDCTESKAGAVSDKSVSLGPERSPAAPVQLATDPKYACATSSQPYCLDPYSYGNILYSGSQQ